MSDIPQKARTAFSLQRGGAKQRGISFEFTLEEWWTWWQTDNRWERRGSRGPEQLVMARRGDVGPYSPNNVRCITAAENIREAAETARIKRANGQLKITSRLGRPPLSLSGPMTKQQQQRRYRANRQLRIAESNARRNEWGTPVALIEAVRATFGGSIDCDPATHVEAQERVRARTYYTAKDDSLNPDCSWYGKVFLNPPYERGLIEQFVLKLIIEIASGRTEEAVVLVNAQTDTQWCQRLFKVCSALCFHTGRVRFLNSDGKPGMPQVGQAIFYIGPNSQRFVDIFRKFGPCSLTTGEPHQRARNGERVEREHAEPNVIGITERNARQRNGAEY